MLLTSASSGLRCPVDFPLDLAFRGRSSVGRALAWHARGRRFDPVRLHFEETPIFIGVFSFLGDRPKWLFWGPWYRYGKFLRVVRFAQIEPQSTRRARARWMPSKPSDPFNARRGRVIPLGERGGVSMTTDHRSQLD